MTLDINKEGLTILGIPLIAFQILILSGMYWIIND